MSNRKREPIDYDLTGTEGVPTIGESVVGLAVIAIIIVILTIKESL